MTQVPPDGLMARVLVLEAKVHFMANVLKGAIAVIATAIIAYFFGR